MALSSNLELATAAKQVMVDGMDVVVGAAQQAGLFDQEIVPVTTTKAVMDKETREVSYQEVTLDKDEGNRPGTTLESLQGLNPVVEGGCITAGNASQLSDGASACVIMERSCLSGSLLP